MALVLAVEEEFTLLIEVERHLQAILIRCAGIELNGILGRLGVNADLRTAGDAVLTLPDLNHPILALVIELVALGVVEHHGRRSALVVYLAETEISLPGILGVIEYTLLRIEIEADIEKSVSVNAVKESGVRVISNTRTDILYLSRLCGQLFLRDEDYFAVADGDVLILDFLLGDLGECFCILLRENLDIVRGVRDIAGSYRLRHRLHRGHSRCVRPICTLGDFDNSRFVLRLCVHDLAGHACLNTVRSVGSAELDSGKSERLNRENKGEHSRKNSNTLLS